MLLFLIALILAAAGVGVYAHYNTGAHDITLRTYHLTGVPDWWVAAAAAALPLFLFLVQAIYANIRIRMLKRAAERQAGDRYATGLSRTTDPQPAPKRSWTP
ncbi:MAG TPA: hypothetical protein VIC57_02415 [Candidatus Dormibacteraeota bacterium]|jgi:hypothetical protein